MSELIKSPEYFELSGIGYNIMTRKPNQYGKFQITLELVDADQIRKAEELEMKYGLNLKSEFSYPLDGEKRTKSNTTSVTFTAREVKEGKYPRKFIPTTKSDSGAVVEDLISHGAKVTVRFKAYSYEGGTNSGGFSYPAGNSFQLESVKVHEYTPFKAKSAA